MKKKMRRIFFLIAALLVPDPDFGRSMRDQPRKMGNRNGKAVKNSSNNLIESFLVPEANAIKLLQTCIYKSVNTGLFLASSVAISMVYFHMLMLDSLLYTKYFSCQA